MNRGKRRKLLLRAVVVEYMLIVFGLVLVAVSQAGPSHRPAEQVVTSSPTPSPTPCLGLEPLTCQGFNGKIRGTVYHDLNGDGMHQPGAGEGTLADAVITLKDAQGNVLGTYTTASDGFYFFTGLARDHYTVIETNPPGYTISTTPDEVQVRPADFQFCCVAVVHFGDQLGLSPTPTRTPTSTPIPPSPTPTSSPTATATSVPPSPTPTSFPTATPVPPSPTATRTPTPTSTGVPPSPTATPTQEPASPTPTVMAVTPSPTATPTETPTATPTPPPTVVVPGEASPTPVSGEGTPTPVAELPEFRLPVTGATLYLTPQIRSGLFMIGLSMIALGVGLRVVRSRPRVLRGILTTVGGLVLLLAALLVSVFVRDRGPHT